MLQQVHSLHFRIDDTKLSVPNTTTTPWHANKTNFDLHNNTIKRLRIKICRFYLFGRLYFVVCTQN